MSQPPRRVTTALQAVLRALCDTDPAAPGVVKSSPRTASEIATLADRSPTTVDGVLLRLAADGRIELGTVARKTGTPPVARPLTSYCLSPGGITYARTVLRLAQAEHDAAAAGE